ncbi:MAG: TerB family tellurite resistance protein [Bacteroidetes bacterium]|nr:TerB family tellurite resistance protein [Bacteroidota bacterium]
MDIITEKQLNILIQLAEADKHFAQAEREMILRIAKDRNFPEDAVNRLIRTPQPIDSLGALSNDQKFEYLISCVELIYADHKIFESELIFVKSIAIKLGFKKSVVEYLFENLSKTSKTELKSTVLAEYL